MSAPELRASIPGPLTRGLPTLLSQTLVAFTIELDNEFEHRMAHRMTIAETAAGLRERPWLASLVMWENVMRYVASGGVSVADLHALARTERDSLAGLTRWGYVVVEPDPGDARAKPARSDWIVRPTRAGRRAQEVWRELPELIEERWRKRLGQPAIAALRSSLETLVGALDLDLPLYLPILGYGLRAEVLSAGVRRREPAKRDPSALDLAALLSQALLAFTLEFERESGASLAIHANLVRLLGGAGVRVRDLPGLSGVSKEAISVALGFLARRGGLTIEPDPAGGRSKLVQLTAKGVRVKEASSRELASLEERWGILYATGRANGVIPGLQALLAQPGGEEGPLSRGLVPSAEGWRARRPYVSQTAALIRDPSAALPHYPMVLHRGGYPDGS